MPGHAPGSLPGECRIRGALSGALLLALVWACGAHAACRAIGARYPYDDIEHVETTLRGNADVVSEELKVELQERVAVAGITIEECRLTHLAYAQEIAQAMLRRQQAEAIIAARQKLVTGAVTMVETALQMLSEKDLLP